MLMIVEGVSLTEIGNRLHLSAKTVSTYRARVMDKMQMKSNAELTRYAVGHGLIDAAPVAEFSTERQFVSRRRTGD
jgi:DNA-binding NarL/FixJ family response regulator